ncbi:MAG: hypothetical protein WC575_00580 [Patescibacteria group bacterium]
MSLKNALIAMVCVVIGVIIVICTVIFINTSTEQKQSQFQFQVKGVNYLTGRYQYNQERPVLHPVKIHKVSYPDFGSPLVIVDISYQDDPVDVALIFEAVGFNLPQWHSDTSGYVYWTWREDPGEHPISQLPIFIKREMGNQWLNEEIAIKYDRIQLK